MVYRQSLLTNPTLGWGSLFFAHCRSVAALCSVYVQMPEVVRLIALAAVAFVAAMLAAVAGFGGAAVLLPMLVFVFGVREAIPILTVAQLIGNGSRVWFNFHELDYKVVAWFALGGVPTAILGGMLFARAPLAVLTRALGVFLILIVVWRHIPRGTRWHPPLQSFAIIGAVSSFLSALLGSVGPLMAPFFLAYGLVKGAYIGTEALSTVVMHLAKLVAYRQSAILTSHALLAGLALGPLMVGGSFAGKRIVDRISERVFTTIIELTLLVAGVQFLWKG